MQRRLLMVLTLLLGGGLWISGCQENPTQVELESGTPAARAGGTVEDGPFQQYPDPYTAAFWAEPVGSPAIRVHQSTYRYVWQWAKLGDTWLISVKKLHPTGNVITSWYGKMPIGGSAPGQIDWFPLTGAPPAYTHP